MSDEDLNAHLAVDGLYPGQADLDRITAEIDGVQRQVSMKGK